MAIAINCNGCGKRYSVPETALGRRVRCVACGTEFSISTPQSEPNPLDELAAQEFNAPVAPAPRAASISYATPMINRSSKPRIAEGGNTPLAELVDVWLPRLLVIIFYAPILVLQLIGAVTGPLPPVAILLVIVGLALLICLVLPLADVGLRAGGSIMRFTIREE